MRTVDQLTMCPQRFSVALELIELVQEFDFEDEGFNIDLEASHFVCACSPTHYFDLCAQIRAQEGTDRKHVWVTLPQITINSAFQIGCLAAD